MLIRKSKNTVVAFAFALAASTSAGIAQDPIRIGLDADFDGSLREVSVAVQQGAEAATHEINAAGGINGQMVELRITNHRSNPRRAADNFTDGAEAGIVAMISGAQSTGALAQLEAAQASGIPLISAFPGSTKITNNGLEPNPAFRVSARDSETNAFLVSKALKLGSGRIALVIENSVWGASNDAGAHRAVEASDSGEIVATGWFALGGDDFDTAMKTVLQHRPDTILLFGKPAQGIALLSALAAQPENNRPRALMHWGVAQGEAFGRAAAAFEVVDYGVFQTFNFRTAHNPTIAKGFLVTTCHLHDICQADQALTQSPLAQGYDAVHLVALGLQQVQDGVNDTLFDAMQALPSHNGLIRTYAPAFSSNRREALNQTDFMLVRYTSSGLPVPIEPIVTAQK